MTEVTTAAPHQRRQLIVNVAVAVLFAIGCFLGVRHLAAVFFESPDKVEELREEDIFFAWLEGDRILDGENPYARIRDSDMRRNDKYATYFPGFYLLSAAIQKTGRESFDEQVELAVALLPFFHAALGVALLWAFAVRGYLLLGVAAGGLFIFGRFNLYVVEVLHLENFVLLPWALSLLLLARWPRTAFLLFGLSLALKQIGIFAAPLFVLHAWWLAREVPGLLKRLLHAASLCVWLAAPPLLVSLPFLLWDAESFVNSVLFSATRQGDSHLGMYSVDSIVDWEGTLARLPMLVVLAALFVAAAVKRLPLALSVALVMGAFVSFNPVLYRQYFVWALVPLLVALAESLERREQPEPGHA